MPAPGKRALFISVSDEDFETINGIAWRTKRTRSEVVLEALRAYYPTVGKSYTRRVEGRNELEETGEGSEENWTGPDWAKHVNE